MIYLKYAWLMITRFVHFIINKIPVIISYSLLLFSLIAFLIILIPNIFLREPVLSYYISEYEWPIEYELSGEIKIYDENENIINNNVEIFVGGYSTKLTSTDFNLKFSSPMTKEVYIVIKYDIDNETHEFTKCLMIEEDNHTIIEEFIIYA